MEDFAELIRLSLELPKGYISKKVINGKTYYYLQYFENGKKLSKYIKKENLPTIEAQLKKSEEVHERLMKFESTSKKMAVLDKRARELTGYLMMEDEVVASFKTGELTYINEQKAPLLIKRTHNLSTFLASRAIDSTRINSRLLKRYLNVSHENDETIPLYAHGAVITDNYWFKPLGSRLKYKDICFDSDMYADIALKGEIRFFFKKNYLNPQLTLIGSFEKCWRKINNQWWIYKKGTPKEYFSELFAYELCRRFGFDTAIYEYDDGYIKSLNFADKYNFEPMSAIADNDDTFDNSFNRIYKYGEDFAKDYLKIIFMDALINNVDRHNENYGFFRNKKTGKIVKMAPNFDNNMSLISRSPLIENCTRDGFIQLFIKFLRNNQKAHELIKTIPFIELTPQIINDCVNNIPIKIEEDIKTPLLKRYKYLIDIIKNH